MQGQENGEFSTPEQQGIQDLIRHIGEPDIETRIDEWLEPLRSSEPATSQFLPEMRDVLRSWAEKNPSGRIESDRVIREFRGICEAILNQTKKPN